MCACTIPRYFLAVSTYIYVCATPKKTITEKDRKKLSFCRCLTPLDFLPSQVHLHQTWIYQTFFFCRFLFSFSLPLSAKDRAREISLGFLGIHTWGKLGGVGSSNLQGKKTWFGQLWIPRAHPTHLFCK